MADKMHGVEELCSEVNRLEAALEKIAMWPDGGNAYGQDKIKAFANRILSGTTIESASAKAHLSYSVDEPC